MENWGWCPSCEDKTWKIKYQWCWLCGFTTNPNQYESIEEANY